MQWQRRSTMKASDYMMCMVLLGVATLIFAVLHGAS